MQNPSKDPDPSSPFCPIEEAIDEIRAGRMVVVVDSPDRENEGDLCMAADHVSPEAIHTTRRPLLGSLRTRYGCWVTPSFNLACGSPNRATTWAPGLTDSAG